MPTFETPEPISVILEIGVGDIRIVAGDRADTVVNVQPTDPAKACDVAAAARASVEYAGGTLRVRAANGWKRHSFRLGRESIDVRVDLPTGSQLRGEAVLAALRCTGTLGECRYRNGGGDITIDEVVTAVDVKTAAAAVRIERIGGSATVKNANGDTWIGDVAGDLQVKAAHGRIDVDHTHSAATVKTANGDIRLGEVASGAIVAETACGKVDVAIRPGVAAWLDLHTGFGHVNNLLDVAGHPGPTDDTVGVRVRSAFGDITVRRSRNGQSGQGTPARVVAT